MCHLTLFINIKASVMKECTWEEYFAKSFSVNMLQISTFVAAVIKAINGVAKAS